MRQQGVAPAAPPPSFNSTPCSSLHPLSNPLPHPDPSVPPPPSDPPQPSDPCLLNLPAGPQDAAPHHPHWGLPPSGIARTGSLPLPRVPLFGASGSTAAGRACAGSPAEGWRAPAGAGPAEGAGECSRVPPLGLHSCRSAPLTQPHLEEPALCPGPPSGPALSASAADGSASAWSQQLRSCFHPAPSGTQSQQPSPQPEPRTVSSSGRALPSILCLASGPAAAARCWSEPRRLGDSPRMPTLLPPQRPAHTPGPCRLRGPPPTAAAPSPARQQAQCSPGCWAL
jgi:hypothetical protein